MEGIAQALEDKDVLDAILNGPQGGILFSMVTWADKPQIAIPWQRISSREEAAEVAARVRTLPRQTGEFTCVTGMLRNISDKVVPQIPAKASRIIVDVSGDGKENCNPQEPIEAVRDELAGVGVTINGLPILEGDDGPTLEGWYKEHVMAGPGSFVLPADGFKDFGRAIRQKFVIEISGMLPAPAADHAEARRSVARRFELDPVILRTSSRCKNVDSGPAHAAGLLVQTRPSPGRGGTGIARLRCR